MPTAAKQHAIDDFVDHVSHEPCLDPDQAPAGILAAVHDGYSMLAELQTNKAWSVWRSIEPKSGREVAIKTASIDSPLSGDEIAERLHVEFDLLRKLSSHRIVKACAERIGGKASYLAVEYAGDDDIAFHAIMKYCDDPPGFTALMLRAVQAVADIHKHDVVHGDLKPQHFVMNEDIPVLIDFGLSADLQSPMRQLNTPPCLAGTPGYIAPEITSLDATHHNARQDVYSLGVTLHQLAEAWSKHSGARVPKPITRVIRKSTRTAPSDRYPDARSLMADLTHAMRPRRASRIAACAATVGALTTIGVGTLIATAPSPNPPADVSVTKPAAFLDLDWTAGHVASGEERERFLATITELPKNEQDAWEAGLVRQGGVTYPFGETPFGDVPALVWRYHPANGALAWYSADGRLFYQAQPEMPPRSNPCPMIAGMAFSENGKRLVLVDAGFNVHTAELATDLPITLDPTPMMNARAAYETRTGGLYAIERINSAIHRWDGAEHRVQSHSFASALPAHSAPGALVFSGSTPSGPLIVAVETIDGQALMPDTPCTKSDALVVCADYLPEQQVLCLGHEDGTATAYSAVDGRWRRFRTPAGAAVSAVLIVPEEDRVFVASHGVHVYRLSDGQYTLTLGGQLVVNEFVTQLAWSPEGRALTIVSNLGVQRWHAAEPEGQHSPLPHTSP